MPRSNHIDRVTLLLVGLSTVLLQVALMDRHAGAGVPMSVLSAALAVGWFFFASRRRDQGWNAVSVGAVAVLGVLPIGWEIVSRILFSRGQPWEVQGIYLLRNLMFGVVAVQFLPRARGLAALASLFLVVTGFLLTTNTWTIVLLVAYAAVGMWWLVGTYWDLLGGRFADETEPSAPIKPALLAVILIGLCAVAFAPFAARSGATTALAGFFPSSGGTQWNDPFAHGGVGDGGQMVAGKENASSFGPIESEIFLESKMPSLYDAINEFSEAIPKKNKRARRAIPLTPSAAQMNHQKRGVTQTSTREFSTVRQRTERRVNKEDHLSDALLLVSGRTPMHLALETYDRWDGHSLIAAEPVEHPKLKLRRPDAAGQRWLRLSVIPPQGVFTAEAETQVRIVNLRSKRVPTPPNTTSATMTQLHAVTMFSFASDGSFAMNVEHIPQLTILRLRSALRDRAAEPVLATSTPDASSSVVSEIATEWTAGVERGWPQVTAVLNRLRGDYEHDPDAMVPDSVDDSVEHFLVHAKRGPDYLFATSAAVMLRALGYDARVRSGLYASPERYDRKSRLTPVLPEDVHFWTEVKSSRGCWFTKDDEKRPGTWVAIEPTPGFEVLYAPESIAEWLRRQFLQAVRVVAARPLQSLMCCLIAGVLVMKRRPILDVALVGCWSIGAGLGGPRQLPRFTLRLLEWRAWLHGRSRPAGTPLGRWDALPGDKEFLSALGWSLYGEGTAAPLSDRSVRDACRRVSRAPLNNAVLGSSATLPATA